MLDRRGLPSFIAAGPRRTASTWLHAVLAGHVGFPAGVKETQFFDRHYHKGLCWYAAHFRHCVPGSTIGEIAPTYFSSSEARHRIRSTLPECKIICTLRDPVDRLYSLYILMRQYGWTHLDFEAALEKHPEMMHSSLFATHVSAWFQLFGRKNVLIMFHEDLKSNPEAYLEQFCSFVGIARPTLLDGRAKVNEGTRAARNYYVAKGAQHAGNWLRSQRLYGVVNFAKRIGLREFVFGNGDRVPKLNPATAAALRRSLLGEIERLEELLGRDLSAWKHGACSTIPQFHDKPINGSIATTV